VSPFPELLAALARLLPRIAEESAEREEVPEHVLAQRLAAEIGEGVDRVAPALAVVRLHLQSLSVLDERRLELGDWAFVSFPASLLARSILMGLGTPGFRLLESGFWDGSEYRIEQQRSVIKQLEELRAARPDELVPIRRVWVSWAWMAMDGKFLMVRREDPARHRDGSRGEFVFPGGRVTSDDLPGSSFPTTSSRLDFFDPQMQIDLSAADKALETAMKRELQEELELTMSGLEAQTHAGEVIVYRALEGAKSAFSATEYLIQPFNISLNEIGRTSLLRCLSRHPERFAWFTGEELAAGVNAGGDKAFVDAIRHGHPVLDARSYALPIGSITGFKDPVDIPGAPSESFSTGVTGRERCVHLNLERHEIELLNWLALVRRGDAINELAPGISVANPTGWVLVDNDEHFGALKSLSAKLEEHDLPLLEFHGRATRFGSTTCFFSPSLMSLEIADERRGKSYRLTICRQELRSPLGVAASRVITTTLPELLGNAIYALNLGDPGPALDNIETVKRMQRDIREFLDDVGIRLLIRQVDGVPELAARGSRLN